LSEEKPTEPPKKKRGRPKGSKSKPKEPKTKEIKPEEPKVEAKPEEPKVEPKVEAKPEDCRKKGRNCIRKDRRKTKTKRIHSRGD
jgi:hypothetical protein